jgi:hypothetical protein
MRPFRRWPTLASHWINARARACLDQLSKGANSILPVEIYDADGVSLLRDDISILVMRELRRTIDTDHSTAAAKVYPSGRRFTFDGTLPSNMGTVRLMPGACEGGDLWKDPLIGNRLFLSERGGDILRSQGILKDVKAKALCDGHDNPGPWD